jgi:hypothetical protein
MPFNVATQPAFGYYHLRRDRQDLQVLMDHFHAAEEVQQKALWRYTLASL